MAPKSNNLKLKSKSKKQSKRRSPSEKRVYEIRKQADVEAAIKNSAQHVTFINKKLIPELSRMKYVKYLTINEQGLVELPPLPRKATNYQNCPRGCHPR